MANVSRITGFRPVRHTNGSPFNGQVTRYYASSSDAVAIYNGDLVKLAAVSDLPFGTPNGGSPVGGVPGVAKFTAGTDSAACGVAVGFNINPLNLNSPQYRLASTAMYVLVVDSPDVVFEVQADTAVPATGFNKNYNVTDGGGSAVTGFSGEFVAVASAATTATLPLKMTGAEQRVDNDISSAFSKVLVIINNHQLSGGTGTLGV